MGQKVDPNGLRIGVIKPWEAKWYADKQHFADNLVEDDKIRKFIKKKYYDNAISKITIERAAGQSGRQRLHRASRDLDRQGRRRRGSHHQGSAGAHRLRQEK